MIVTPLFGDQFFNAAAFANRGMGAIVHYEDLTKENIVRALDFALSPTTLENAQTVSYVFRNRLQAPLATAIWWVEHVAATKGAPLTKSHAVFLSTFIYYSLDVLLVILVVGLILICSPWMWALRKLFSSKTVQTKTTKLN